MNVPIERRAHCGSELPVVGGTQGVQPAPGEGDGGQHPCGEETEQVSYEIAREKRQVARRDEDAPVPRGRKTCLDTGQRPLAARAQIGDVAAPGGDGAVPAYYEYLLTHRAQGSVDPIEEGSTSYHKRELVPAHPPTPPANQDHAGRSRSQGRPPQGRASPRARPPLSSPTQRLRVSTFICSGAA